MIFGNMRIKNVEMFGSCVYPTFWTFEILKYWNHSWNFETMKPKLYFVKMRIWNDSDWINPPAPRRGATRLRGICSILYIWPRFAMESYYSLAFFVFSHFGSSEGSDSHFSCLMSHISCLMDCFSCLMDCLLSPKKHRICPKPPSPKSRWKFINFRACLQGNKSHENWSQGHPKSWKIDPGIIRNPISTKVDFCNTFHAKCLFFQSQTPKFRLKNQQKKQPGNRYGKNCFFGPKVPKKLSEWAPKINKKSIKSKPGPHRALPCAPQCPRIVPGPSQDRPRIVPGTSRTPK